MLRLRQRIPQPKRELTGLWFWIIIALSVIYLCFEMAFNAHLLDVVGTLSSAVDVHHLETQGRLISATGCTLLVFSWIANSFANNKGWKSLFLLIGAAAVCGPAIYFGENALIVHLAHMANAKVRRHASDMLIMKKGLAEGDARIKGLPYEGAHPSPTDKTFLSLSGALVFSNPKFLREVESRRASIVKKTATTMAYDDAHAEYRRYRRAVAHINHDFDRYYHAYRRLEAVKDNARARAQKWWIHGNSHVLSAYHRYEHAESDFNHRVHDKAREIVPKLREFLNYRSDCYSNSCRARLDQRYQREAARYIHNPPPWEYWCNPVTRKAHNIPLFSFSGPNGHVTHVNVGWGKKVKTNQFDCHINQHSVETRLRPLAAKTFAKKAGAPPGQSYAQFVQSPRVRHAFIKRARKAGVKLPKDFHLTDKAVFMARAEAAIRRKADARYRHGIEHKSGHYIRPGLSRAQFEHLGFLQRRAKREMHWHRRGPVSFHMTERAFEHDVVMPQARRRSLHALHSMEAKQHALGEGQKYAQVGRNYVKDVIVPPIALTFSLFFGLFNFLNLVKELMTRGVRTVAQRVKGMPAGYNDLAHCRGAPGRRSAASSWPSSSAPPLRWATASVIQGLTRPCSPKRTTASASPRGPWTGSCGPNRPSTRWERVWTSS